MIDPHNVELLLKKHSIKTSDRTLIEHTNAAMERGDMTFEVDGKEVIRIKGNGDFMVNGRKVTNDKEVYKKFKAFSNGICP